jgi:hypothetical protein
MEEPRREPGPLEPEKHGETSEPGRPQPEAAEVESARLLANHARPELEGAGLDFDRIRELADEYVALDLGNDLGAFISWARDRGR